MNKKIGITIIYMVILMTLSLIPGGAAKELNFLEFFQADKLLHIAAYLVLAFLLMYSITDFRQKDAVKSSLSISISYGILMELLQYFTFIGRHFEFADIIANIIGSILGVYFYIKLKKQ